MVKDKIVIIGANDFQNPLILKAKELNLETHVFAWQDGSIGERTADFFYPISITEKEKILEKCKEIKPKAIVSIASDLAVWTVNYVSYNLGLTCNDPNNSLKCTNKYEMRKAFMANNISTPKFKSVSLNESFNLNSFKFPLIVKPTDRSGSRGIALVKNEKELMSAIEIATQNSFEKQAIIEEFIDGDEYSCECISFKGLHTFLATTKKFTTGAPNFIENGHIQPSGLSKDLEKKVIEEIFKGLDALGVKNGPSHSEFKINKNEEIRIIEIGARMGGDCIGSDLVKISTGFDFLKLTIDIALGKNLELKKVLEPKIAIIKFIFDDEDSKSLGIIEKNFPDLVYFKSTIAKSDHKIVDSSSRLGYFILNCNNLNDLININNELKKYNLNELLRSE